jgi:hypothetical protein
MNWLLSPFYAANLIMETWGVTTLIRSNPYPMSYSDHIPLHLVADALPEKKVTSQVFPTCASAMISPSYFSFISPAFRTRGCEFIISGPIRIRKSQSSSKRMYTFSMEHEWIKPYV